jgi:hypothetical protein
MGLTAACLGITHPSDPPRCIPPLTSVALFCTKHLAACSFRYHQVLRVLPTAESPLNNATVSRPSQIVSHAIWSAYPTFPLTVSNHYCRRPCRKSTFHVRHSAFAGLGSFDIASHRMNPPGVLTLTLVEVPFLTEESSYRSSQVAQKQVAKKVQRHSKGSLGPDDLVMHTAEDPVHPLARFPAHSHYVRTGTGISSTYQSTS